MSREGQGQSSILGEESEGRGLPRLEVLLTIGDWSPLGGLQDPPACAGWEGLGGWPLPQLGPSSSKEEVEKGGGSDGSAPVSPDYSLTGPCGPEPLLNLPNGEI